MSDKLSEVITSIAVLPATSIGSNVSYGRAYTQYALVIFLLCHACITLDRHVFAILLQPIKREFNFSDTELGFVSGVSYALFYSTMGIPLGWLADRTNRRNVVAGALTVFSAMTALMGTATGMWQLVLCRMGVGFGEAGVAPPIHAIIADMFPQKKRGAAMSYYAAGSRLGTGLGFFIGGWIGQIYGWRAAFVVCGLPGLLLALLFRFTLREPVRGAFDPPRSAGHAADPPLLDAIRFMWSQRAFRHVALGGAMAAILGNAYSAWLPTFLARSFGMSLGYIGTSIALIMVFVAGSGVFVSGYFADRFGRTDVKRAVVALGIVYIIECPALALVFLAQSGTAALIALVVPMFFLYFHLAPVYSWVQSLAPVSMRATASGLMFFAFAILGNGIGPQLIGILSDLYAAAFGVESVRYALLTVILFSLWSSLHLFLAARTITADIEKARAII